MNAKELAGALNGIEDSAVTQLQETAIKAREEAAAQGAPEAAPATDSPFKLTEDQLFGVIDDLARQVAAAESRTAAANMAILGLLIAAGGKVVVTAEHVQKLNLFGFSTESSAAGQSCTFSLIPVSPEPAAVQ